MSSNAPKDNLVRALIAPEAVELRSDGDGDGGRTLHGHFAVFNEWTEIHSMREGDFRERIAPGAFSRSIAEHRDRIKVLYDHGRDPQLGNKPLGRITDLGEDKRGAFYEVDLIDARYNDEFVIPAASAGLLGASFRFSVTAEEWEIPDRSTKSNPAKLPERTITDLDLYEFGPVTFPAYEGATAGVRSLTDDFMESLLRDPRFVARFVERAGLAVTEKVLDSLPPTAQQPDSTPVVRNEDPELPPTAQPTPGDSADGQPSPVQWTPDARRRFARQIEADALGIGKE